MKSNKGITLVALIITIAVLVIITAVTVNSLTDKSIIDKAKQAKENYSTKSADETTEIQKYVDEISAAESFANGETEKEAEAEKEQ